MAELSAETRLREIVKLAQETLPVIGGVLALGGGVPADALPRLKSQKKLQERLLTLALYTLSNLPDDPEERAEALASTLRVCSDLAQQG
ncbi:MAG: hypothetical protein HIU92_02535 [Proteobacteria bacterium]|nr:hypothetical protein [Pseudomonadota bacterium]